MATPPGGHPYGNPQQQPLKRFNFPSAPSHRQQRPDSGPYPEPERRAPYVDPLSRPSYAEPEGHGYRDDGYRDHRYQEPAQQSPQPPPAPRMPTPRIEPHIPTRREPDDPGGRQTPFGSDQQPLVRPYAMTGGRTRPRYQLAIEALVSTTADPDRMRGQLPEHQRICHLCREVKSVAEVSALLSIPLGVARILVADLAEAGLVAIHQPGGDEAAGGQPDVTLLERVLSGLRKL